MEHLKKGYGKIPDSETRSLFRRWYLWAFVLWWSLVFLIVLIDTASR